MTCANSVLPTFIPYLRSSKPDSTTIVQYRIQIVDTHKTLKNRVTAASAALPNEV